MPGRPMRRKHRATATAPARRRVSFSRIAVVDPQLGSFRASMHGKSGEGLLRRFPRPIRCVISTRAASVLRAPGSHPAHICAGTGLATPTSAPRLVTLAFAPARSCRLDHPDSTSIPPPKRKTGTSWRTYTSPVDRARLAQAGGVGCRHCEKAHLDAAIVCSNGLSRERNGAHLLARSRHGFDDGSSAGRRVNMRPC